MMLKNSGDCFMKRKEDLLKFLREDLSIEVKVYDHEPFCTVEHAMKVCGHLPGAHCKNLFLKDKEKKLWLVVALGSTKVDLKQLAANLGTSRFRFVKEEDLLKYLGVTVGAVTPFGIVNDVDNQVTVIVEKALFDYDLVNFHPLVNDATVAISSDDFKKFLQASGNEWKVLDSENL